jgi:hypothetical protein
MHPNVYLYLHWAISVVVISFLAYLLFHPLFGKMKRKIRLEGFESTGDVSPTSSGSADLSGNQIASTTELSVVEKTELSGSDNNPVLSGSADKPALSSSADKPTLSSSADKPTLSNSADKPTVTVATDTDKSTIMAELFENVNKQMDIVRTFKLSDTLVPILIDKAPQEDVLILANLKLLVNNGVSKNELDLKEVYDKYIGNKAVAVLVSDMNSLNLVKVPDNVADLETIFLFRTKAIVDAHQKIIDKILDNKSKQ